MCSIGYHLCPACSEEYKCDQPNSECPTLHGYDQACMKCEYWIDEERKESEMEARMRWERNEWEREFGKYYEK